MKRREDIINLRAAAILLVMMGHSIIIYSHAWPLQGYYLNGAAESHFFDQMKSVINLLQMPLFFSLSGFCLLFSLKSSNAFGKFMTSKTRRILIPFFAVGLLYLLPLRLALGYPGWEGESLIRIVVFDIVLGVDNGHLWFLPTLFIIFLITEILYCILRHFGVSSGYFVLALVAISLVLKAISGFVVVPYITDVMTYDIWFVLGVVIHYVQQIREDVLVRFTNRISLYLICILSVAVVLVLLLIATRDFKALISMIFVTLCYALVPRRTTKAINAISRNSMGMYLFHSPLCYISFTLFPSVSPYVMLLVNFVGFGMVAFALTEVVRRLHLGVLIGE